MAPKTLEDALTRLEEVKTKRDYWRKQYREAEATIEQLRQALEACETEAELLTDQRNRLLTENSAT